MLLCFCRIPMIYYCTSYYIINNLCTLACADLYKLTLIYRVPGVLKLFISEYHKLHSLKIFKYLPHMDQITFFFVTDEELQSGNNTYIL